MLNNLSSPELEIHSWIKQGKGVPNPLDYKYVFIESGLGADKIINKWEGGKQCHNVASRCLDPASRPKPKDVSGNHFPPKNETIILNENFLRQFGFDECKLEATYYDNQKDKYKLWLGNPNNDEPSLDSEIPDHEKYLRGNVFKNGKIKLTGTAAEKREYLYAKEMGDVLQVIFMLLHLSNSDTSVQQPNIKDSIMTTCDMVVFCSLLYAQIKLCTIRF